MAKIDKFVINNKNEELRVGDQIIIENIHGYWTILKLQPKFPKYPRNYPKDQRSPYTNYKEGLLCCEIKNPKNERWVKYNDCSLFKKEEGKYYGIYD
jgi:hypothetical protein